MRISYAIFFILLVAMTPLYTGTYTKVTMSENFKTLDGSALISVNVTFTNGTVLSFNTIDNWLQSMYNYMAMGKLQLGDIADVSVLNWSEYLTTFNSTIEALNETAYKPAYSLYFYRVFNATPYNYSGHIVASTIEDYLVASYKYEGVIIYGKVNSVKLKAVEDITELDESGILVFANFSEDVVSKEILDVINSTPSNDTILYLVDISNKMDVKGNTSENVKVAKLEGSLLNGENISTALGLSTVYPVVVGVFNNIIVWKSVGVDSLKRAINYLSTLVGLGEKAYYKIAGYRVMTVLPYNLYETKVAKITIFLTEGVGDAKVKLSYKVLDGSNKTMQQDEIEKNISSFEPVTFEIELKNGSRYIVLNVSVNSEYGQDSYTAIFKVERIYAEKQKPKIPWSTIFAIVLVIAIFVGGVIYYRRKYVEA